MAEYEAHLKKRAWLIVSDSSLNEFVSNRQFVLDHLSKLDELRDCLFICAPDNAISYFSLNGLMKIGQLDFPDQFSGMMCEYVGDVDGIVCLLFNGVHLVLFNPVLQKWNIPSQITDPTKCSDEQASHLCLLPLHLCVLPLHLCLLPLHDRLGLVQLRKGPGCTSNETGWGRKIWSMQQSGEWTVMFTLPLEDFGCLKRYLPLRNELIMVEDQVDESFIVYLLDAYNERKLERKLKVDLDDKDAVDTCLASLVSPS